MTMELGNERKAPLGHCMTPFLDVRSLHVSYDATDGSRAEVLAGLNFSLGAGETIGVLGESGSGKSTLAAALLGILPSNGRVTAGRICFEGQDLLKTEARAMEKIRGARIALISQEPSQALHPAIPVGAQVRDVIARARVARKSAASFIGCFSFRNRANFYFVPTPIEWWATCAGAHRTSASVRTGVNRR
jgi:ABC-type glutathione transport system ATPase component